MIPLLLSALLAAGQPAGVPEGDDSTFSERQPVRLEPLPLARALAAYRDICMAHYQAAAASDLGFVRAEHPERDSHEWSSRHGQIVFRIVSNPEREARRDRREGHASRQRWRERCDYWVPIEDRLDPAALVAAIEAVLRKNGATP